jgi:hypothetical protein
MVEILCRRGSNLNISSQDGISFSNIVLVGFLKLALLLASDPDLDSPINERLIQNSLGCIEILAEHGVAFDIESVQQSLFPDLPSLSREDRHTVSEWAKQSMNAANVGYSRRHARISQLRAEMQSIPVSSNKSKLRILNHASSWSQSPIPMNRSVLLTPSKGAVPVVAKKSNSKIAANSYALKSSKFAESEMISRPPVSIADFVIPTSLPDFNAVYTPGTTSVMGKPRK